MSFDDITPTIGPIEATDIVELVTERMQLAEGHPLRGSRCVVCGGLIGGLYCKTVTVLDYRCGKTVAGGVPSAAALVHDAEFCSSRTDLADLVLQAVRAAFGMVLS